MERPPLDVRGWVSGLNFVLAVALVGIGLAGLVSCLREVATSRHLSAVAASNLLVGIAIPIGIILFRSTAKRVREENAKDQADSKAPE